MYPKIKIGDIAKIKGGKRLPKGDELISIKTKHPYIRAQDIGNGKITLKDPVYLTDDIFNKIKNYVVKPNDVCITIVGAYVGDVGIVPYFLNGANLTENAVKLTDLRDYNAKFLNYALLNEDSQSQMKLFAAGAAQPKLGLYKIEEVEVPNPPLQIQNKIAAILTTYDDFIENNTRRIKILEEMAQNLYREWFVYFRFPGHENVQMVDSPLGEIPEGWVVETLGEVALNFDSRRKPLSSMQRSRRQGMYPYYGAAKILDYIDDFIFNGKYLLIAEDGSVITPNGKPVLQLVNAKFWVNNHTHILQGKMPVSTEFLYFRLIDLDVSGYITGAAQPKITQTNLNRIHIIVSSEDILLRFNEIAENCVSEIVNLQRRSDNLRSARDLLLPKLISGELDVDALEIKIGGMTP
jgi:type I restriction enzyme S subunit